MEIIVARPGEYDHRPDYDFYRVDEVNRETDGILYLLCRWSYLV